MLHFYYVDDELQQEIVQFVVYIPEYYFERESRYVKTSEAFVRYLIDEFDFQSYPQ